MKPSLRIFLSTILIFICFSAVYPCSCIDTLTSKQAVKNSKWVLKGKVVSKSVLSLDTIFEGLIFYQSAYSIEVLSTFKGRCVKDTITIITGMGDGDCGYPFVIGREYIIYAIRAKRHYATGRKVKPFITTNICDRTTDKCLDEKKEIAKNLNRRWRKV